MGAGQAAVTGPAQAAVAEALGEGGLDTGADRVTLLPVLGLLVQTVAGLDLVEFTGGQQGQCPGTGGRSGVLGTDRTGQAGGLAEADLDVVVTADPQRSPVPTDLSLRAGDLLILLVHGESGLGEAVTGLGLVAVVGHDRTQQGDAVHPAGAFDLHGADVGGVDHVLSRSQATFGEVVVDRLGELAVLDRGDRGRHVHHHLGQP